MSSPDTSQELSVEQAANQLPICTKVPIESESEIVEMYVEVVQRNRSIRAAVIDHISSQSAIQEIIRATFASFSA